MVADAEKSNGPRINRNNGKSTNNRKKQFQRGGHARSPVLLLHEGLEAPECRIPIGGDLVEVVLGSLQACGFELPDPLAPVAAIPSQPRIRKDVEMFGNRLAGDLGAFTQLRDGERSLGAQARDHAQPRGVSERREHGRRAVERGFRGAMRARHSGRCCASVRPSLRRSS